MNILPKKRWHVRTKENIARVRKDEAEAAEKEKQERLRTENADREARLDVLKRKSKQKLVESGIIGPDQPQAPIVLEHINLFEDLEHAVKTTNKDHDEEVKEKKEDYEKKIGYLTYLGQDTNEALKKKNWYEVIPEASRFSRSSDIKDTYDKLVLKDNEGKPKSKEADVKDGEIAWKAKQLLDPLNLFRKYGPEKVSVKSHTTISNDSNDSAKQTVTQQDPYKHKMNHKKTKKDKDDRANKILKLREARLKREKEEKYKTELFLTGLHKPTPSTEEQNVNKVTPKYNSQFNPELAKQNYR